MRDAQQVQRNTKGLATLQWLVAPEPTVGVGKFRSIVTHWLRARLGIPTIADELVKLRRMVIEMASLIDAYDMEVRLIARKN
jgi:hypothetical protein